MIRHVSSFSQKRAEPTVAIRYGGRLFHALGRQVATDNNIEFRRIKKDITNE